MKNIPNLIYLRFQLRYLKFIFYIKQVSFFVSKTKIFSSEFFRSVINFFGNLGKLNKAVFLGFFIVMFVASGVILGKSYSQDFPSTSSQTNTTNGVISSTYSVPPGAVEAEMVQFFSVMNQVIQGSPDSSGTYSGGVIQLMSNVDAYVYLNNPISLQKYASFYAQSHGLIPNTYAATSATTGSGYNALAPVIPLWDLARNIAYLIIAVMIVVIGFIIIFGGKYGQTEVTIVNSIPKIILALILITFSYPIAGFAIDISNLGTNLIVNVLGPQFVNKNYFYPGQYPVSCNIPTQITGSSLQVQDAQFSSSETVTECGYYSQGAAAGFGGDYNVFRLMAPLLLYHNWSTTAQGKSDVTKLIQTPTNIGILDFFLQDVPFGVQGLADITVDFVLEVLFLYWAIKIFILILSSFIRIVMATLVGPFVLVSYPLSGATAFWNFAKSLLAPALVFPAVFGMLFIAAIFAFGTDCLTNSSGTVNTSTSVPCAAHPGNSDYGPWFIATNNNIVNFNSGPLMFVDTVNPAFIWNIVAIGLIVAIPGIGKQIDEALKNEVSRHFDEQGRQASQNALKYLQKVPFVGGLIGNII